MGQYVRGDVILALLSIDEKSPAKIRPAIVVQAGADGRIRVCPVSSKPPTDAPCIPIALEDFSEGGLDLFGESYVIFSRIRTLHSGDVIGKKGRLTQESLTEIAAGIPGPGLPDSSRKNTRTQRSRPGG
jgi:mRNA-degrading endonuclease toxin of MazEF toxin-antitoxin module